MIKFCHKNWPSDLGLIKKHEHGGHGWAWNKVDRKVGRNVWEGFWAQGNDQWSLELEDLLCLNRLSLELKNLLCFSCWTLLIFSLAFKKQLWVDAIILNFFTRLLGWMLLYII